MKTELGTSLVATNEVPISSKIPKITIQRAIFIAKWILLKIFAFISTSNFVDKPSHWPKNWFDLKIKCCVIKKIYNLTQISVIFSDYFWASENTGLKQMHNLFFKIKQEYLKLGLNGKDCLQLACKLGDLILTWVRSSCVWSQGSWVWWLSRPVCRDQVPSHSALLAGPSLGSRQFGRKDRCTPDEKEKYTVST